MVVPSRNCDQIFDGNTFFRFSEVFERRRTFASAVGEGDSMYTKDFHVEFSETSVVSGMAFACWFQPSHLFDLDPDVCVLGLWRHPLGRHTSDISHLVAICCPMCTQPVYYPNCIATIRLWIWQKAYSVWRRCDKTHRIPVTDWFQADSLDVKTRGNHSRGLANFFII